MGLSKTRICSYLLATFFLIQPQVHGSTPFSVVIDPGHGGSDEGTVFDNGRRRISEKVVTLQLAKKVAHQLIGRGIQVTLTRDSDTEVLLPHRTALANRLQADVFISIHMNSTDSFAQNDPEGIETFILNNATDASSRKLARLENSVISTQLQESPDQTDVALILKDLRLDANLGESKRLACHIQENLVTATSKPESRSRRNRGVKQALFHVLLGADMPSILVEAGFLSSAHDRNFVLSRKGQSSISRAIATAVDEFRHRNKPSKTLTSLSKCKIN